MKRNAEFEVCYYAEANGYLAKCHCKCVTEVVTHKGSMTFESEWKRAAHFDFVAMTDDSYIIMDNNYDWLSWSYQA